MIDFKAPYSREDSLSFLDRFLPDDFKHHDEEVKPDFKPQFIRSIKKIGEVASLDNIHVYEITHESENDPRVSLSKDSFRLLAHFNVKKALIFFVSKSSSNYRLSLVTVDLKWESGAKVKREYSNPRRYSFFLGPDARVHTPRDFLINKGQLKDISDLLSRFDVEIVTKEFFIKYKGLYEDVSSYLGKDHGFRVFAEKHGIDIDTFAKKLLGQIVFCYFLQRKGWLGAKKNDLIDKGDKDFMRSLFNRCICEKKNFFNDCLEYLFYGSLNSRAENVGDFYRKHLDCQIPFLNGGLFEPPEDYDWEKSFVHIPDRIFSSKDNTGILDVFDLYNFTVYEDDPIDREVSVDPEMLGKVFENLLPENLRKGQGAYYTPREIVHYMCQESLINYLATETKVDSDKVRDLVINKHFEEKENRVSLDKALKNIRVCDPACGSGAFLVGMLHEIVSARRTLDFKADEYHLKKEAIQNCIYGVDIDPGAVDIAKLRLWLSLVVDYELRDIEPLPNLDYKIMCGNSLLEEFEGVRFYDGGSDGVSLFKDERKQKIQELREKVREYFNVYDEKEKRKRRGEINKLKDWFIKTSLEKRRKEITRERRSIEAKADMFQEKNREEYFTAQGKIFISEAKINEVLRDLHNPQKARPFFIWKLEFMDVFEEKGGFDVVIANPPYVSVKEITPFDKQIFSRLFETGQGRFNLFTLFLEKGNKLLRNQGILTFILPEGLYSNVEYQYIRTYLLKNTSIIFINLFSERVFEAAVDASIISTIRNCKHAGKFPIRKDLKQEIISLDQEVFNYTPFNLFTVNLDHSSKEIVYRMLESKDNSIEDILEIQQGIIYSGQPKEKVFSNEKRNEKYKKVLDGRDVLKWMINWNEKKENRFIYYTDKLHRAREERLFLADEKILLPRKSTTISCAYDNEQYYCLNTAYICLLKDRSYNLKFILAILNSKLINYFYSRLFFGWQITIPALNCIKVPNTSSDKELVEAVDKILKLTGNDTYLTSLGKQSKVKEYENDIDRLVYELYGLGEKEITLVESSNIT